MRFRDRFFTKPVARAITSPGTIITAGSGAAIGILVGLGPIGGRLYPEAELGAEAARVAVRILRGEDPDSIPTRMLESTPPVFDARALRRWGIHTTALPPGSVVRVDDLRITLRDTLRPWVPPSLSASMKKRNKPFAH